MVVGKIDEGHFSMLGRDFGDSSGGENICPRLEKERRGISAVLRLGHILLKLYTQHRNIKLMPCRSGKSCLISTRERT